MPSPQNEESTLKMQVSSQSGVVEEVLKSLKSVYHPQVQTLKRSLCSQPIRHGLETV